MATDGKSDVPDPLKENTDVGKPEKEYAPRKALALKPILAEEVANLDSLITEQAGAMSKLPPGATARMFQTAMAVNALRRALTPQIMACLMELQGSRLGFRTDKDTERRNKDGDFGYPEEIVRDVAIEALLVGARMTGNEVNIIARNGYLTKEFYQRALKEYPGLTDFVLQIGVPALVGDKGAFVEFKASWKLHGVPGKLEAMKPIEKANQGTDIDERIVVRVNVGMGADAILGKAERKIRKRIYDYLIGRDTRDADVDDPPERKGITFEADPKNEPPPEPRNPEPLKGVEPLIQACTTEDEVDAAFVRWSFGLSGTHHTKLLQWCDAQKERLRKSKGKKP